MKPTFIDRIVAATATASLIALPLTFAAVPAKAQFGFGGAVYCTNCASSITQATQVAQAIQTALNTANQLRTQIQQYQNMVQQGISLPSAMFYSLTSDIRELERLYQDSVTMAGNMAGFDRDFRAEYGDYERYLTAHRLRPDYMDTSYRRWHEQGADAMRVAMLGAGMNVSAIENEDAMLSQLVDRSQNAQGRMQALQASNEIAAMQVQQIQKLRQLVNGQIQAQSLWYAQNIERQAADDAARQLRRESVNNSRGRGY